MEHEEAYAEAKARASTWAPPKVETHQERYDRAVTEARGPILSLSDNSMGEYLFEQQTSGKLTPEEVSDIQNSMVAPGWNAAKSAIVAPGAVAPDLVGQLFKFVNWSTGVASEQIYGDSRGSWNLPEFSGDPLREAMGIDIGSVSNVVGEVFGGWESLVAKGGTMAAKAFSAAMHTDPGAVLSGIMGIRGATRVGDAKTLFNHSDAVARLAKGENPATVMADTHWYRDKDGKMKIAFSDSEVRVDKGLIRALADNAVFDERGTGTISTTIGQVLQGETQLFKAYPQLRNMPVHFSVKKYPSGEYAIYNEIEDLIGTKASTSFGTDASIEIFNAGEDLGRSSLLHEIQHQIQVIEEFGRGADSGPWKRAVGNIEFNKKQTSILKEVGDGNITDASSTEDINRVLTSMYKKLGTDTKPTAKDVNYAKRWAQSELSALDEEAQKLGSILDADSRTIGTMLNELGLGASDAEIKAFLDQDYDIINGAILTRYRNQGGEVEARIVQLLEDHTQAELEAIDNPLSDLAPVVGTPSDRVVHTPPGAKDVEIVDWPAKEVVQGKLVPRMPENGDVDIMKNWRTEWTQARVRIYKDRGAKDSFSDLSEFANYDLGRAEANVPIQAKYKNGVNKVTLENTTGGKTTKIDLLKNPTEQELKRWAGREITELRVLTDMNGNYWVWNAEDAMHDWVIKNTKLKIDMGADWTDVDALPIGDLFNVLSDDPMVHLRQTPSKTLAAGGAAVVGAAAAEAVQEKDDYPKVGTRSQEPGVPIINPDGSGSTEKTISVAFDDGVYLIPTIIKDEKGYLVKVSNEDAIKLYREGKNPSVGKFKTEEEATAAAKKRSEAGGRYQ